VLVGPGGEAGCGEARRRDGGGDVLTRGLVVVRDPPDAAACRAGDVERVRGTTVVVEAQVVAGLAARLHGVAMGLVGAGGVVDAVADVACPIVDHAVGLVRAGGKGGVGANDVLPGRVIGGRQGHPDRPGLLRRIVRRHFEKEPLALARQQGEGLVGPRLHLVGYVGEAGRLAVQAG